MDFSNIDTKRDASAGAWLHFRHPQLGHPLYTGEGVDETGKLIDSTKEHAKVQALVAGIESQRAKEAAAAMNKLLMKDPEAVDNGDNSFDHAIALVIEIEGVQNGERTITASREDLLWFFKRSDDLAVQVLQFAGNSANFFKPKSKG